MKDEAAYSRNTGKFLIHNVLSGEKCMSRA